MREGNGLLSKGRVADAIVLYKKSLAIVPDCTPAMNNLAYLLATSRDDHLRDGAKAVELALKANKLTGGKAPVLLDTLAAAYAEQGRFAEAGKADREAISRALESKNAAQANAFKQHLSLYESGQTVAR